MRGVKEIFGDETVDSLTNKSVMQCGFAAAHCGKPPAYH